MPNATDIQISNISPQFSVVINLCHDSLLKGEEAYFQFVLLYTTIRGDRMLRIHNLASPVTNSMGVVFRGADMETIVNAVARRGYLKL